MYFGSSSADANSSKIRLHLNFGAQLHLNFGAELHLNFGAELHLRVHRSFV